MATKQNLFSNRNVVAWLSLVSAIGLHVLVVDRGGKIIRAVTVVLGILMLFNALGHLLGSMYFGRILPGMWSSPLLFLAALYVVIQGFRGEW